MTRIYVIYKEDMYAQFLLLVLYTHTHTHTHTYARARARVCVCVCVCVCVRGYHAKPYTSTRGNMYNIGHLNAGICYMLQIFVRNFVNFKDLCFRIVCSDSHFVCIVN